MATHTHSAKATLPTEPMAEKKKEGSVFKKKQEMRHKDSRLLGTSQFF
jgi:hypothetical protein